MRRTFCFLATLLALSSTESLHAAPARFLRTPDISPDGKLVAFSYLGDIWVVDAAGGTARHLSMHERHDINPIFSPDGKKIAFSSNRHGGYDVFVVPVEGGRPTRLTHDSAEDHPTAWSPDGRHILFASNRGADYPSRVELYRVPVTGGLAQRVSAYEGREGSYSPAGDLIAYVRGPGSWYRRGYRGSSNDDLWLSSADGTNNRLITRFVGQDNAPMWSADGKSLFYVSEYHGAANIVRQDLETDRPDLTVAPPVQITFHKDESVGKARISRGGNAIVYECGADLCIVSLKEGKTRKLAIDVHADDKTNLEKLETFSAKATEYAISHDEKHIAFVVHGEIFLMPRNGGKARRLT
jgi:tricorn protease